MKLCWAYDLQLQCQHANVPFFFKRNSAGQPWIFGMPITEWPPQMLHFEVADVWAYIASHNVAYNAVYDRLAALGVSREQQRVASYAGGSQIGDGRWALLKRGWPDLFNRFAAEFPAITSYT